MRYPGQWSRWLRLSRERSTPSLPLVRERVLELGDWLRSQNYIGFDVKRGYPREEISTVAGSALMGWIDLYRLTGDDVYRQFADQCLHLLLDSQREGVWLFPYPFRKNAPGHVYACENFMTIRALLYYWEHISRDESLAARIRLSLDTLADRVGHQGGRFWYSGTDEIRVPNISSMAANTFARVSRLLGKKSYAEQAEAFARYCRGEQRADGAYPYFEGGGMVYLPYHALETWELTEANEILDDPALEQSTDRALDYLERYFEDRGYDPKDTHRGMRRDHMFKTPLWGAKAFLSKDRPGAALEHYWYALQRFRVPGQPYFFYRLPRVQVAGLAVPVPLFDSVFIRYNASCFEIGCRLLQRLEGEGQTPGMAQLDATGMQSRA